MKKQCNQGKQHSRIRQLQCMMQQIQPQKATIGNKAATMHDATMQPRKATLANKAATMHDATNATTKSNTLE